LYNYDHSRDPSLARKEGEAADALRGQHPLPRQLTIRLASGDRRSGRRNEMMPPKSTANSRTGPAPPD
jgi:hypothetical protein